MDRSEARQTHGAVTRHGLVCVAVAVSACATLIGACRPPSNTPPVADDAREPRAPSANGVILNPPNRAGLQRVSLPDFSAMEPSVRDQLRARYAALVGQIEHGDVADADLGAAYGELGKLLMAASYFDAAEACYLNAGRLAPADMRWPYYLGHLYKAKGPLAKSVVAFEKAHHLRPNAVAILVWLGDAYLTQGRSGAAEPLFNQALGLEPNSAAAHFGAGRVALAKKDYPGAVTHLEKALALDPRATATHYQLGMAYRARGDFPRAEAQLARKGTIEPRPIDPLMRALDELLESAEAYNVRGGRELEAGNWAAAAGDFRKGLELKPSDPSLRHRLGTALYQMGDVNGAVEQFDEVIRTSPEFAKAHFSRGVLMEAGGRHARAVEDFSTAIKYDPGYIQARVQLAAILARTGRPREAIDQYERVLASNPGLKEAALGYAMALVRLHKDSEARDRLNGALKIFPDDPVISHSLARLLAASPDAHVRDPARAK